MQDYVKQESKYLSVNGRALLELTRGAPVILNPASEYGKELTAEQVGQLLDPVHGLIRGWPAAHHRQRGRSIRMPLVEALTRVFAGPSRSGRGLDDSGHL